MTVTKEMIEAMKSALVKYSVLMPIDAALSDALSAALSSRSAEAGKPAEVQLHAIVDAWEALPGGRRARNSDVEEWLAEDMAPAINAIRGFLRRPKPDGTVPPAPHADDIAVDQFAAAMKAKLAKKRAEGRGGWENKGECTAEFLSRLLREHVEKGDPVDVGNLAMMLQQRGECISALSTPADSEPVALYQCEMEDGSIDHISGVFGRPVEINGTRVVKVTPLYAAPVAVGEPVSVPDATAMKPVPYDHEITLQSVKASSGNVDGADPRTVLLAVLGCTETWVGDARIIGNVRAVDIAIAIRAALAAQGEKQP